MRTIRGRPVVVAVSFAVALTFGYTFLLEPIYTRCNQLPASTYEGSFILGSGLGKRSPWILILQSLICFALWNRTAWSSFGVDKTAFRVAAMAISVSLGWIALSEFNYFHSRWFIADRLILGLLTVGVWVHPAVFPVLLMQLYFFNGQFAFPLGYSHTGNVVPLQIAGLFSLFVAARSIAKVPSAAFLIAAMSITGAHYLLPAIGKLEIGWLNNNETANIFAAAWWHNGWLPFLSPAAHVAIYGTLKTLEPLTNLGTLFIELSVVIFLFHRRLAIGILTSLIGLHLSIFALTGIFFWKWIIVDCTLLALVVRTKPDNRTIFGPIPGLICCYLMLAFATSSPRIVKLAWFDTKLNHGFRFEALNSDGQTTLITPSMFAPYETLFSQGRFHVICQRNQLVGTLGSTVSNADNLEISNLDSVESATALIENKGHNKFDKSSELKFRKLLEGYIDRQNRINSDDRISPLPSFVEPIQRIWTYLPPNTSLEAYDGKASIEKISVYLEESLFQGGRHLPVSRTKVLEVSRKLTTHFPNSARF